MISSGTAFLLTPFIDDHGERSPSAPVCTASGFFIHFGYVAPYYNMALSFCFAWVIVYDVRDRVIACRYEPALHTVCFLVHLICAIAGLCLQVYNPNISNTGCWVNTYPSECDEVDSMVACERRGESANTFVLAAVLGSLCIILVFHHFLQCQDLLEGALD
jgi:hypothetical protein